MTWRMKKMSKKVSILIKDDSGKVVHEITGDMAVAIVLDNVGNCKNEAGEDDFDFDGNVAVVGRKTVAADRIATVYGHVFARIIDGITANELERAFNLVEIGKQFKEAGEKIANDMPADKFAELMVESLKNAFCDICEEE